MALSSVFIKITHELTKPHEVQRILKLALLKYNPIAYEEVVKTWEEKNHEAHEDVINYLTHYGTHEKLTQEQKTKISKYYPRISQISRDYFKTPGE